LTFSPVKILFLSGWYPNRIQPRLGNFIQRHAEAVALKDEVASLFVTSDKACKETYEVVEKTIRNVYTVNVYYKKLTYSFPGISQMHKFYRYIKAHRIGYNKIEQYFGKPDVIHENVLYPAGTIALMLKFRKSIPYLITEHSTEYHLPSSKNPFVLWLKKKIASSAVIITPVSENLAQAMRSKGLKGKYEVVNNVVNTAIFYPPSGKSNSKIIFLHISTMDDRQKNISGLLRTVAKLSLTNSDFELHIIGDEEYMHHMEYAQTLDVLNKTVFFEGTKTLKEVSDAMREADCFVMFSNYENFPCVIAEAMTCGLPVISTDVGGIGEHINEDRGLLVETKNETALLKAFLEMMNNIRTGKYNKEKISNYGKEQFGYENVAAKFHSIYERIKTRSV
jgi:glycosyltransferase involved in cell wall biosynthesis